MSILGGRNSLSVLQFVLYRGITDTPSFLDFQSRLTAHKCEYLSCLNSKLNETLTTLLLHCKKHILL